MDIKEMLAAFEAILFALGESVPRESIAEALNISEEKVEELYDLLTDKYKDSGIRVFKVGNDYQLSTKKEYYEYIRVVSEPKRNTPLSNAALEVLSIVAYKQPITRSQIDYIRGVDSSSSMSRLINCGLIEAIGVSDAPGRPSLYATTKEFLRVFGLETLSMLPEIGELEKELELEESDQLTIETDETEEVE